MSLFAPSLGIDLPYGVRLFGFLTGVALMLWPISLLLKNKQHKQIFYSAFAASLLLFSFLIIQFRPLEAQPASIQPKPSNVAPPGILNEDSDIGEQNAHGPGAIENRRSKIKKQNSDMAPANNQPAKDKQSSIDFPKADPNGNPCRYYVRERREVENYVLGDVPENFHPFQMPPGACIAHEVVGPNFGYSAKNQGNSVTKQDVTGPAKAGAQ